MAFLPGLTSGIKKGTKAAGEAIKGTTQAAASGVRQAAAYTGTQITKGREAAAEAARKAAQEAQEAARKAAAAAQSTKEKIQDGVKYAVNKAGDALSLAPIAPFMPVMSKALKSKGIAHDSTNLTDTALKFYNNIARKQTVNNAEGEGKEVVKSMLQDPSVVKIVLNTILNFFTWIKDRFKRGDKMSDAEKSLAQGVVDTEKTIENFTGYDLESKGEKKTENTLVIVGIIILLVFILMR